MQLANGLASAGNPLASPRPNLLRKPHDTPFLLRLAWLPATSSRCRSDQVGPCHPVTNPEFPSLRAPFRRHSQIRS